MTQRDYVWYRSNYPFGTLVVGIMMTLFGIVFISPSTFAQDTTQAPTQSVGVVISSPTANQAVGNNAVVPIEANVENAAEYRIIIDGIDVTGWLATPYQAYQWNTGDLLTGDYTVKVEARPAVDSIDITQASVTMSVNNTPPLVSSSLIAGSTVGDVVAVSGSTNGDSATYQLALFNNKGTLILSTQRGQLSFNLDTTKLANGAYTAAISAEDSFGNRTLANVTFQVFNAPPVASQTTQQQSPPPASSSSSTQVTPAIISPSETNEVVTGQPASSTAPSSATAQPRANQVATDSEANKGTWQGQMWYWWLGIIAAGAVGAGFVIAHRKRRGLVAA
jgi:hypothetical protein